MTTPDQEAASQPVGEQTQVQDAPRVIVYVKPSGKGLPVCQPCKATIRKLDEAGIRYSKITVHNDHVQLIDELRQAAAALGVASEMPCVHVYDPATGDDATWFGYQPDRINQLKEDFS